MNTNCGKYELKMGLVNDFINQNKEKVAYIYELAASEGRQSVKIAFDLHLRQRGKTLAKPLERGKFKPFRKRAEVK